MKPLTLAEVIEALQGTCDRPVPPGSIRQVATDSRELTAGDLFVAIRGERFDGHDFVGEAFARGALAAVVRDDFDQPAQAGGRARRGDIAPDALLVRVDDTVRALGRLARYYRRSVMGRSVTVVAVTGSNGKTTTKGMIAHVLAARWQGRASAKSFNNEIGVPLTLLSVEPADTFVVCEVGTNAPGEIAALAELIEPEVAVITGVSEAHLAGLGTLADVATEKLSLLYHLRPEGCAVVNADCDLLRLPLQRERDPARFKHVTFGQWPDADLRLTDLQVIPTDGDDQGSPLGRIEFTVNDRFRYHLAVPGRHNVFNALAAIAVARRLSMDHEEIAERLASFTLPPMRMAVERIGRLTLINDAYNANPASMAAAVEVLCDVSVAERRVLIVGDMRELGPASELLHRQVAEQIGRAGIDLVITVGENARLIADAIEESSEGLTETHAHGSVALAQRRLTSYLRGSDTILIKGSRALALEKLAAVVRDWAEKPPDRSASKKESWSARRLTV